MLYIFTTHNRLCTFLRFSAFIFFYLLTVRVKVNAECRSHSDTPHLAGLLWTRDRPVAVTYFRLKARYFIPYGSLNDVISSSDCTELSGKKTVQSLMVSIGTTRFNIKTSALVHTLYLPVPMIPSINSDCPLKVFSVR